MKDLLKSKTFYAALAAIATVAGGYMSGELSASAAITAAFLALSQIFQRQAITKAAK